MGGLGGGTYLLGLAAVAVIGLSICLAARALRMRFLPEWSGPLAVLASSVIAVALLEAIAQLLGTFGWLKRVPLLIAVVIACTAIVALTARADRPWSWRLDRDARARLAAELRRPRRSTILTLGVIALAFVPWIARTVESLRTGVLGYDSLNYHLPHAARFFQTGRITSLYFSLPGLETAFHPLNDELVRAIGLVATTRDYLSPYFNLVWLAVAMLAAWCTPSRRAMRPLALAGAGMLLATPFFVAFDGGRATNDIAAIALFLASVALLVNSRGRTAAVSVAAVASGLSLGTKLTMVVPVLALAVGVIVIAVAGSRLVTAVIWIAWLAVSGGYWYARNLVTVGNPIPPLAIGVGPVSLPSTKVAGPKRSFTVAHYLGDLQIWRSWFIPGVREVFGWTAPLVLGLALAGTVLAIVRGNSMFRMLGCVAVVALIGYVLTPQSAGGFEGRPVLFDSDIRFAFPALALGLVMLPSVVPRTNVARRWLLALLGVGLMGDLAYSLRDERKLTVVAILLVVVLAALVFGALFVVTSQSNSRQRRTIAAIASVSVLVVAMAGWAAQHVYFDRRYTNIAHNIPYGSAPKAELTAIYKWVHGVHDARIALNGLGTSYPLFGVDDSNRVQYVAHRGPHGAFDEVSTCAEWRQLLNDGKYDYVVISPDSRNQPEPKTAAWTRTDPAAVPVLHTGKASVFRVDGPFDPATCP
jgi:hypothetical protein